MHLDLLYKLTDYSKIPDIEFGCMLNDEQREAIKNSLKYVSLTVSIGQQPRPKGRGLQKPS